MDWRLYDGSMAGVLERGQAYCVSSWVAVWKVGRGRCLCGRVMKLQERRWLWWVNHNDVTTGAWGGDTCGDGVKLGERME